MSIQLRYAARSHVGLVRKNNQDSGYAGPHLLVLADGMGGPAGGDIASSVAVAHLAPLDADSHAADDLLNLLRDAIQGAHQDLLDLSGSHHELHGLGTTCVAILRSGNKMAMVHVGDSRAYLLRDGELTQVTKDHSFVQYLVESGELTPEEAAHHPKRSVLLRVLGDSEGEVTLDESVRAAVVGDRWLLCSDGLSGVVSAETIATVLTESETPESCCEELVGLALKSGAPDNVTCVIADVVDSDAELTATAPQIVGAASTRPAGASISEATPAEKAAMLRRGKPLDDDEAATRTPKDPRKMSKRGKFIGIFVTLLILAGLGLGAWFAYGWTQTQYFLGVKDGEVTVYQGINQSIGSWELSKPVQKTGLRYDDLAPVIQERLKKSVSLRNRDEAVELITSWRNSGMVKENGTDTADATDGTIDSGKDTGKTGENDNHVNPNSAKTPASPAPETSSGGAQ